MNVIKRIIIPIDKHIDRISAAVKKGSNTDVICITLTEQGKVYDLDNVDMVAVKGIKPDGLEIYNTCVINNNEIHYSVTDQTVNVKGIVKCELVLFDNTGDKIISAGFELKVYDEIFDDEVIESENEYGVIQTLISEAEAVKRAAESCASRAYHSEIQAQDYYVEAQSAATRAESARADAVNAKDAADVFATAADDAKSVAVASAVTAGSAKDLAEGYANAAQGYAGEAAGSATSAAAAKNTAISAKDIAESASAEAVSAKASAQNYAGIAEGHAEQAATDRTLADEAAETAVNAKNNAVDAKDTAVSAKATALESAATAVSAKDDAVSAKNDAVTAKEYAIGAYEEASDAAYNANAYKLAAERAKTDSESAKADTLAARDEAVTAATEAVSVVEYTAETVEKNESGIKNIVSGYNLDSEYAQIKLFDNDDRNFEKVSGFADKGIYLLLFDNASYLQTLPEMYTNVGILCALTSNTTATSQRFNSSITKDRIGITANPADRRNALWLAESYNGSSSQFTLRNVDSKQYLRNNGGTLTYSDTATSGCVWTLKQHTGEGYIFTILTPMNDSTKYIRVSNGSNVFKFGSTSNDTDGRNANLYLYKVCANSGDTYTVDLTNSNTVSGNSQRTIDANGNLVITSTGAGQNTVIKPPLVEICKLYKKITVRYTKSNGTFAYKYHKLCDPTSDPQGNYKWGTGDEYKFPSSSNVREVTFDTNYLPVDEFVIFDWNAAGVITVHSIVYSEPRWIGHDYCTHPEITKKPAVSIKAATDCDTDYTVYASNNAGASSPSWEDITEAVKNRTAHIFANTPNSGYGLAVWVMINGVCRGLSYLAAFEKDTTDVVVTQGIEGGSKVGTVSVDGTETDLYTPFITISGSNQIFLSSKKTPNSSEMDQGCIKSYIDIVGAGGTTVTGGNDRLIITSPDTFNASGANHAKGLVPDPGATQGTTKYLREDGSWAAPPDTTYSEATSSNAGLMSSSDKQLIDNIKSLISSETEIGTYNDGTNEYTLCRRVMTTIIDRSVYDLNYEYGLDSNWDVDPMHITKIDCTITYTDINDNSAALRANNVYVRGSSVTVDVGFGLHTCMSGQTPTVTSATCVWIVEYYKAN